MFIDFPDEGLPARSKAVGEQTPDASFEVLCAKAKSAGDDLRCRRAKQAEEQMGTEGHTDGNVQNIRIKHGDLPAFSTFSENGGMPQQRFCRRSYLRANQRLRQGYICLRRHLSIDT